MGEAVRQKALEAAGLIHPKSEAITAPLFVGPNRFFLALDKVQVKYEMLCGHIVDGLRVTEVAPAHGYSRAAFYLVLAAFESRGMLGLLDERRGRRGPIKITPEIVAYLQSADPTLSGAQLAAEIAHQFGVNLHRRTVERARQR